MQIARTLFDLSQLTGEPMTKFRHVLVGDYSENEGGTVTLGFTPPAGAQLVICSNVFLAYDTDGNVVPLPAVLSQILVAGTEYTEPNFHFAVSLERECLFFFKAKEPIEIVLSGVPTDIGAVGWIANGFFVQQGVSEIDVVKTLVVKDNLSLPVPDDFAAAGAYNTGWTFLNLTSPTASDLPLYFEGFEIQRRSWGVSIVPISGISGMISAGLVAPVSEWETITDPPVFGPPSFWTGGSMNYSDGGVSNTVYEFRIRAVYGVRGNSQWAYPSWFNWYDGDSISFDWSGPFN